MITYVYAVPFAGLRRLAGSKDRGALRAILAENGDLIRLADDHLGKGATFRCADALAELVDGSGPSDAAPRYLYRCALEAACSHLGEFQGEFDPSGRDDVDAGLARLGVPLSYSDLLRGDGVVPLPACDLPPYVGSWPPEQVAAAVLAFRRSGIEALPWDEGGLYEELDERVGLIRHAVEEAARRPGWGVVAFSY